MGAECTFYEGTSERKGMWIFIAREAVIHGLGLGHSWGCLWKGAEAGFSGGSLGSGPPA